MSTAAAVEDPNELEADAEDSSPPDRASFFAEEREPEICHFVYRLYLRDSVGRRFATPAEQTREEHRAVLDLVRARRSRVARTSSIATSNPGPSPEPKVQAPPTLTTAPAREDDMTARGSLGEQVSASFRKLEARHGSAPTSAEVFADLGEEKGKSLANVRMALKRQGLSPKLSRGANGSRQNGHATNGHAADRPSADRPSKRKGPRVHVVPRADDHAPPSGGVAASLAIMALQQQRTKLAAELEAIDSLIERLSR